MINTINSVTLGTDSGSTDLPSIDMGALDESNTIKNSQADIFESILHTGLDPINSANNDMQHSINAIAEAQQKVGGIVDPSLLTGLQTQMSYLVVGVTVATKVVNASVKSINELAHIQ